MDKTTTNCYCSPISLELINNTRVEPTQLRVQLALSQLFAVTHIKISTVQHTRSPLFFGLNTINVGKYIQKNNGSQDRVHSIKK